MPTRLKTTSITDKLVSSIVNKNHTYLKRADQELEALVLEHGLSTSDIASPLAYPVEQWMISEVGRMVCVDESGIPAEKMFEQNIVDDPYAEKLKYYQKQSKIMRGSITAELIKNIADTPAEFASSPLELYRG